MRLAVFSDVHGNLTALEAVLSDIKNHSPDMVFFAGDLCLFGARPAECLERLRQEDIVSVYGNTDLMLTNQPILSTSGEEAKRRRRQNIQDVIDWTRVQLSDSQRAWLHEFPFHQRVSPTIDPNDDLFIVHANPKDADQPIFPSEEKQQEIYNIVKQPDSDPDLAHLLKNLVCGTLAFGHVHIPNIRHWQHIVLANISSVSLPQDGDKRAKYGLFTWQGDEWHIEHQFVPYDVEKEIEELAERQPPGWQSLSQRLTAPLLSPEA